MRARGAEQREAEVKAPALIHAFRRRLASVRRRYLAGLSWIWVMILTAGLLPIVVLYWIYDAAPLAIIVAVLGLLAIAWGDPD